MAKNKEEIFRVLRYLCSAGSSFLIDILLFTLFCFLLRLTGIFSEAVLIIIATVAARVLSSLYNYLVNSRFVFKARGGKRAAGYFVLVVVQMGISAGAVAGICAISGFNSTEVKAVVDVVIFIVNYLVQRWVIFGKR